jgi:hypothetical protein
MTITPPPQPTKETLIHAYRHLLRAGLRAVQFSKPSRYMIVDKLRTGFRDVKNGGGTFDGERIRRTIWFLNAAAQTRGLEHRILKNLCRVHWEQNFERGKMPWKVRYRMAMEGHEGQGKKK